MPMLAMLVAPTPHAIPFVPQLLEWNQRFADSAEVVWSKFTIHRQSNVAFVATGCITATMPCPIIQKAAKTTAAKAAEAAKRQMGNLKQAMCVCSQDNMINEYDI